MQIEKSPQQTHVIAVGNQKGGVGKTSNTVHIAAALAELGRKVLIIDLDMNHSATRHFNIPADGFLGTFEVLTGEEKPEDVIITEDEEDITLPKGIHILPSRRKLENIDKALAAKSKFTVSQDVLLEPLESLRGKYDYILLDTAPNATTPTVAAYKAADWFILCAMPDPFAIAGLSDALSDIQDAQKRGNKKLRLLGVILSGVDKRTSLANALCSYVDQAFDLGDGISGKFKTTISRSTVVPTVQMNGTTLFQSHRTHKVTEQYRLLVKEIEKRIKTQAPTLAATTGEKVANG